MNTTNTIISVLSDKNIIGVMSSSISIMILGFYLGKSNKLKSSFSIPLGEIILTISIPALSFNAFMKDFDKETFVNGINILIWSFLIHLFLMAIGNISCRQYCVYKFLPWWTFYMADRQDVDRASKRSSYTK